MTKPLPAKAPPVRRPFPGGTRKIYLVPDTRCDKCRKRWEDVRFYGLPPSALCPGCPHVADWTGKLFDGFE